MMLICPEGSLLTSITGYPGVSIHPLITSAMSRYDVGPLTCITAKGEQHMKSKCKVIVCLSDATETIGRSSNKSL